MDELKVGDRVRLNVNGSFQLPRVAEIKDNEVVLQRRKKGREIGKLTIPKHRLEKLTKPFRGSEYECTVTVKL